MSEKRALGRQKVAWPVGVGALLLLWVVITAIGSGSNLPPLAWIAALLGIVLIAVGLLRGR